jgi:hypothetical protein
LRRRGEVEARAGAEIKNVEVDPRAQTPSLARAPFANTRTPERERC